MNRHIDTPYSLACAPSSAKGAGTAFALRGWVMYSVLLSAVWIALASPANAAAPKELINVLRAADDAWVAEKWQEAAAHYEKAHRLDRGKHHHLFNAAAALERIPDACVSAAAMFRKFVRACGPCDERLLAEHRLLQIEVRCPQASQSPGAAAWVPRRTVEAEGWADIREGREAEAREAARRDAVRRAVETEADIQIRSTITDTAQSVLERKEEKFSQRVKQTIQTSSEGLVHGVRVLSERREGDIFKVRIAAEVDNGRLHSEIARIASALAMERHPRVLFIVREEYEGKNGELELVRNPTLDGLLQDALIERHFMLLDRATVAELRNDEKKSLLLDRDDTAIDIAMKHAAELVVTATATVRWTSFDDFGQKEHHGTVEIAMKAVDASNGELIARFNVHGTTPANVFDETSLRIEGVRALAPAVLKNLLDRVTAAWTQTSPRTYSVKLWGASDYETQALPFIRVLQRIPGVESVKELSWAPARSEQDGRLELDVRYTRFFTGTRLRASVLQAVTRTPALAGLKVGPTHVRDMNFALQSRRRK